jgi:hypothetical protein
MMPMPEKDRVFVEARDILERYDGEGRPLYPDVRARLIDLIGFGVLRTARDHIYRLVRDAAANGVATVARGCRSALGPRDPDLVLDSAAVDMLERAASSGCPVRGLRASLLLELTRGPLAVLRHSRGAAQYDVARRMLIAIRGGMRLMDVVASMSPSEIEAETSGVRNTPPLPSAEDVLAAEGAARSDLQRARWLVLRRVVCDGARAKDAATEAGMAPNSASQVLYIARRLGAVGAVEVTSMPRRSLAASRHVRLARAIDEAHAALIERGHHPTVSDLAEAAQCSHGAAKRHTDRLGLQLRRAREAATGG